MRLIRRVTQRVAPALASVASILLFATCDFDKITAVPEEIDSATLNTLFSITPGDSTATLGGNLTFAVQAGSGVDLSNTVKRFYSNNANVASIDSITGALSAKLIGSATITARVLAP